MEANLAAGRRIESGDDLQQRRLSAPRWADDRKECTRFDDDANVFDRIRDLFLEPVAFL
jgi:hypothetical protein